MKIKIFLIGSCYSGYMFKEKLLGSMSNGKIQLVYQHQHDSLISIMSNPYHVDLSKVQSSFQWDFNHFAEAVFEKNIFDKLVEFQPDYLMFDTYAEAVCSLFNVDEKTYITNNYYIADSTIYDTLKQYPTIEPDTNERWELFKTHAGTFFDRLYKILPEIKVILVRSRGAEEILEQTGTRRFLSAGAIEKRNKLREKYDEYILSEIKDVRQLCMSDVYNLASKTICDYYNYSLSSNHFSPEYYRTAYGKLQNIIISDLLGGEQEPTRYFNQAICILAQEDFPLLLLQTKIYKDFFMVYIHIDPDTVGNGKEFSVDQIEMLRNIPNVSVFVKYRIHHGSYNELCAIIEMSDMAFRNTNVNYVHITSNYDMPIRPINEIYNFYDKQAGEYSFLNNHANGDREQMKKMASNTYQYYYFFINEDEENDDIKKRTLESIMFQKELGITRNSIGEFTDLYKGVIWGSLSREAYSYCMQYVQEHPEYLRDIKYTRLRAEFFFHTVLFNSSVFKEKIKSGIRGGKHGWNWDEKKKDYETVDMESYNRLKENAENLFVRKVSSSDSELIHQILKDIRSPYKLE